MPSVNEITGANLVSKSSNQEAYAEGYDRIFGNKEEPEKGYSKPIILSNKIQCNKCKDIIESYGVHDYVTCSCGHCSTDGGTSYLRRIGNDYIDLSEITSEDEEDWFEKVREVFTWSSRGKLGNEPLHRIKLSEMSTEHLENILKTQYHIRGTLIENFIELELEYREQNDKRD